MATTTLLLVAALSSLGEEMLFRSLLTPWLGIWGQGALFGVLHQMPGRSRWVWMLWAAVVGLVLGAMYRMTGSLVGPLVAHAFINALNLLWLRDRRGALSASGSGRPSARQQRDLSVSEARQRG
jgi:hypothetical protein